MKKATLSQKSKDTVSAAVDRAIQVGDGLTALGAGLGVSKCVVWNWRNRGSVPPEYAPAIEALTQVSRKELRPDDWSRLWPELAE